MMQQRIFYKNESEKDFSCIICLKDYENLDTLLMTPCGHEYHYECIKDWFRKKNKCPICKFSIIKKNLKLVVNAGT